MSGPRRRRRPRMAGRRGGVPLRIAPLLIVGLILLVLAMLAAATM